MVRKEIWFFIFCLLYCSAGVGQQIEVQGSFAKDSTKLGEETPYILTARYPRYLDVIFPDSTYNYNPFEYINRNYFTTRSDSITSFDSVVYYLSTFEIDSVQYLQLPVYIPKIDGDSTAIYASPDSLVLAHVIQQLPDSVDLRENTSFIDIAGDFNYPVAIALLAFIFIVLLVVVLVFGKRISKWIRVMMMKRKHRKFVKHFYEMVGRLKNGQAGIVPEDLLSEWKKYMEKLEKEPYTKLTSKELIALHSDQRLKDNLRSIDRYIYGNISDRPLSDHFEKLLEYSIERYDIKIEEVRHG